MNKKEIFKKIGGIVAEITEQYQYLSQDTENINELELELFMANSHFLAEHLVILQKLNLNSPKVLNPYVEVIDNVVINQDHVSENFIEPVAATQYQEFIAINTPISEEPKKKFDQVFQFENEPIEQLHNPELSPDKTETIDRNRSEHVTGEVKEVERLPVIAEEALVVPIELPKQENPIYHSINEEQKGPAVLTLNDILSGKTATNVNVASQLNQQQSVQDLKSIINLNDKLLFIKDLFNGYSLAYSEAIDLVNKSESFEAAEQFLNANYAHKNGWSQKQITVDKLHDLISRKFAR